MDEEHDSRPAAPPAPPAPAAPSVPLAPAPAQPPYSPPLILRRSDAHTPLPTTPMPGRALVYTERSGRLVHLTASAGRKYGIFRGPRHTWWFEVDTTLRADGFTVPIWALTETAWFEVSMNVEWAVSDPARVVDKGIDNGAKLVWTRLLALAREFEHRFRVEQVAALTRELNARLGAVPQEYPEGITVHRCDVAVDLDPRSLGKRVRIDDARAERQLKKEEVEALRASINTSSDLFLEYLAQDRERVGDLIVDMRRHEQVKDERVKELFDKAVEQGIMHPAEISEMLSRLLGPGSGVFAPGGRTDLFTRELPAVPPAARSGPPTISVEAGDVQDVQDGHGEEEEDVLPSEYRTRAENGVTGWRGVPWDS